MNECRWVRVTTCDSIPTREGRAVTVAGRDIAIFNLGDRFLATDNRCPHKGGPLSDGITTGASVVCPLHAWRVNLDTGAVERPAAAAPCVATYPTRVEAGVVVVGFPIERGGAVEAPHRPSVRGGNVTGPGAACAPRKGHAA